jgi:hypothetical protein
MALFRVYHRRSWRVEAWHRRPGSSLEKISAGTETDLAREYPLVGLGTSNIIERVDSREELSILWCREFTWRRVSVPWWAFETVDH